MVQILPPKIASEMLWNVKPGVREKGAWRGGVGMCQAQEGVRQASKARAREGKEEAGKLRDPAPEALP